MFKLIQFLLIFLASALFPTSAHAEEKLVSDIAGYQKALKSVEAGDTIVLENGTWTDFEILFEGQGTETQPITLKAQTAGKVIISGQSNLRLAGKHLIVSGLVFKDGYTPTSAVISFRKNKDELANHSRVTEVVIDGFNNPERYENESWVMMYGQYNRFDHNHIANKKTKGVTMAVRLNTPESQENYHRIDNNYFGPRQILGSNGGETLRVGTSHYSLTDSYTTVENNYFDRCDGELEIISNKAGKNRFIGNVFYQSRGTLTMRHGNDTLVENNVFFGNGADHTGGIRVINKRQTIRNNYLEGLAGYRFGGALVVMNGVPNSKINRYHQVEDSIIENNTLVNSDHIQLAAGSDFERSAVPIRTRFNNNLIVSKDQRDPFTIYDDVSGIAFDSNVINASVDEQIKAGFVQTSLTMGKADNGLQYPSPYPESSEIDKDIGVSSALSPIEKSATGVNWYAKPAESATFDHGRVVRVKPGLDTLADALKEAKDGDVLSLRAGQYAVSRILFLDKAITIKAAKASKPVEISFERGALFEIQDGGNLKLSGLTITGEQSPDSAGNSVIRTQRRSMLSNYRLEIEDTRVIDLDINHSFNFLSVSKGTFADEIKITNSEFKNITGAILSLDKEADDLGIYNAEYVIIRDSSFDSVQGDLVDFYRGGTDESTFGPHFELIGTELNNVGQGKRNKSKSSMVLHGVQVSNIHSNTIKNSLPLRVNHTVGEPVTRITKNAFTDTPELVIQELYSDKTDTAELSDNRYLNSK